MKHSDFALIAEVIKETMADRDIDECVKQPMIYHMSRKFAHALRQTNPNFNEARFLKACGLEQ